MKPHLQLNAFIQPYDEAIQKLTIDLRDFITDLIPEANELIWDNYNAVAIAYSKSDKLKDAFCHIAVYSKHVNFGFNRGAELTNMLVKMEGSGKLIRHIKVKSFSAFPKNEISEMMREALTLSERVNGDLIGKKGIGESMVMSISKKKIRPVKGE